MKRFGFTLAEVMLVVGLLGVVAALTIPNLYYDKMRKEYSTKIKHFYSKMDNAVEQMQLDKGDFRDMKLPANNRAAYEWYMENIDPYMGHKYIKDPDSDRPFIYFKDGSRITLYRGGCVDVNYNVDGDSRIFKVGRKYFFFLFCFDDNNRINYFGDKNSFWGPYGVGIQGDNITRQDLIDRCSKETLDDEPDTNGKVWCSKLLQYDGWEFKRDYPAFH